MNKDQKKAIQDECDKLGKGELPDFEAIRAVAQELDDAFNDLSEKAQEGEKGQKLQDDASELNRAADDLEAAIEECQTTLETVINA